MTERQSRYQSVGPSRVSLWGSMPTKRWSANPLIAEHHPAVLDAALAVDELEPHQADVGLHGPADHLP